MSKKFTIGKAERLKSRKRIDEIFQKGRKISFPPFRAMYLVEKESNGALQFSAGVSSRNFKKAVDRNRVKRLMKEAWRIQKNELRSLVIEKKYSVFVFVNYNGKDLPEFRIVHEMIGKLIASLTEQLSR